jgi:hypothetical protein
MRLVSLTTIDNGDTLELVRGHRLSLSDIIDSSAAVVAVRNPSVIPKKPKQRYLAITPLAIPA